MRPTVPSPNAVSPKATRKGWRIAAYVGLAIIALVVGACGGSKGETAAETVTVTVSASETTTTETTTSATESTSTASTPTESKEATVAVGKMGVAQGSQGEVGYGLVLKNLSTTEDAIDVTVTVNILNAAGDILTTEAERVNVIPAGSTYYLGGETYINKNGKATKIEPIVDVGSSEKAAYRLPKVTKVKLTNEEYIGLKVSGEVENTLTQPLSQLAKISAVVFDAKGNVLGGGFAFLDANLPPGTRAGFETANGTGAVPAKRAVLARVSMNNEVVSP